MPNVSIAVLAQDNYSTAIKTMSQVTRGFSKDAEDMQKKLDMLNKNKVSLKVETDKARSELRVLEKQFAATGDEADGLKMQLANENFENLRRNLGLVSKGARDVERSMSSAISTSNKMENRAGIFGKAPEIGKAMFAQGAGNMIGQALMTSTLNSVGSKYGDETGTMTSNILSSMATMATMGAMVAGPAAPIGAAIGGAVGAGIGMFNGASQNQQKRDDAFKGVVQSEYDRVLQQQQSDILTGASIASSRETDRIAFSKLYKSDEVGNAQLEWVKDNANTTPFLYEDLKTLSKTLATYGYGAEESQTKLMQIGDTGAALGLNNQDMAMVATGLGRMKSTDKTTMEYMNLLIERGIDATGYLAEAYGTSKGEISEAISKGQIKGSEAADIIANLMGRDNAGAMEQMSKTFGGLSSTLEGLNQEMQASLGAGFTKERSKGMQEQIDFMGGDAGQQMLEDNEYIGAYQASLENEREMLVLKSKESKMDSDEYKAALQTIKDIESLENERMDRGEALTEEESLRKREASATLGRLLMEAQVEAENEYQKGDGYQLQLQTQKTMLDNMRMDLTEGWENFGYSMSQEFTKGIERGKADLRAMLEPNYSVLDGTAHYLANGFTPPPSAPGAYPHLANGSTPPPSVLGGYSKKAFGQITVPFDNFPALLHQGERVLTASEARAADRGGTSPVTVTGNNFSVREEADIDKIALALAQQLMKARVSYAP